MAKSTVTGSVIVPPKIFSISFTEIFLLLIIIVYESLCFLLLAVSSLAVGNYLEFVFKALGVLPLYLNSTSLQSVLAITFLPMSSLVLDVLEGQSIRPAINRAKMTYPYVFTNIPPLLSIGLVFYSFWTVFFEFQERFDIFIEEDSPPLNCLGVMFKSIFRKCIPCKSRDCWVKVDEDLLEEAGNTFKFVMSLLYLNYFLWKWVMKYISGGSIRLSSSAMMELKVNALLTAVTLMSAGVLDKFSEGLVISPDFLMIPLAVAIALFAQGFPWNVLFSPVDQVSRGIDQNEKKSYWVDGLYFLLSTSALACIFFAVDIEKDYYSAEEVKSELSPIIRKDMLERMAEHEDSVKWSSGAFRGIYGFQIVIFLRTLITSGLE